MSTEVHAYVNILMEVRHGMQGLEDDLAFEQAIQNILAYKNPEHLVHICAAMYDKCESEDMMENTLLAIEYYISICSVNIVAKHIIEGLKYAMKDGPELAQTMLEGFLYLEDGIDAIMQALKSGYDSSKDVVIDVATRISKDKYDRGQKGKQLLLEMANI